MHTRVGGLAACAAALAWVLAQRTMHAGGGGGIRNGATAAVLIPKMLVLPGAESKAETASRRGKPRNRAQAAGNASPAAAFRFKKGWHL